MLGIAETLATRFQETLKTTNIIRCIFSKTCGNCPKNNHIHLLSLLNYIYDVPLKSNHNYFNDNKVVICITVLAINQVTSKFIHTVYTS